jgi:hypothetical protein
MRLERRKFVTVSTLALTPLTGCAGLIASEQPAHTVSVYLGERDETHEVTVSIKDSEGTTVFEQEYILSDENEANEDGTFPESTEPETVIVTVDGKRIERNWPGFETEELPCEGDNWAGIEVYVENGSNGSPDIRIGENCQHIMMAD